MEPATNGQAAAGAAAGELSAKSREILAQAGVLPSSDPSVQEPDGQTEIPKELEIDVGGGVKRRLPVTELTKAFMDREQTAHSKQLLDQQLADMGNLSSIKALRDRIAQMPAQRRAKVLELMQEEEPEEQVESDPDDALLDKAFPSTGNGESPPGRDPAVATLLKKFGTFEKVLQALAARENQRLHTERTTTTSDRLDALMGQYSIFKSSPDATSFAKDSIMQVLAASDDADLDKLVAGAAAKLQKFVTGREEASREELGVPRTMPQMKGLLNANGLRSGKIRDAVTRLLSQR